MADALFYHLERQPLDKVLPTLVEKARERGWRIVIQVGNAERMDALDTLLWTYRDDSFLAHATLRDPHPERQPVLLTTETHNPNHATVRFLVDGADMDDLTGYDRLVFIFHGGDEAALARARAAWSRAKAASLAVTYWQQGESGRWEKKA